MSIRRGDRIVLTRLSLLVGFVLLAGIYGISATPAYATNPVIKLGVSMDPDSTAPSQLIYSANCSSQCENEHIELQVALVRAGSTVVVTPAASSESFEGGQYDSGQAFVGQAVAGDEIDVLLNGASVATIPIIFPEIDPPTCGSHAITGTVAPGYRLGQSELFVREPQGSDPQHLGTVTEAGGRYTVEFPHLIEVGTGVKVTESREQALALSGYSSASLFSEFIAVEDAPCDLSPAPGPPSCLSKGELGSSPNCHINHPPVAVKDFGLSKGKPTTVNVLTNDHDPDGDHLTLTHYTQGAFGTVVCKPTGTCTYSPGKRYPGNDSFSYTVSDGNGGTASARVFIRNRKLRPSTRLEKQAASTSCYNVEIGTEAVESEVKSVWSPRHKLQVPLKQPLPASRIGGLGFAANVCFAPDGTIRSDHGAPSIITGGVPFFTLTQWDPPLHVFRREHKGRVDFEFSGDATMASKSPQEKVCVIQELVPPAPTLNCDDEFVQLLENIRGLVTEAEIREHLTLYANGTCTKTVATGAEGPALEYRTYHVPPPAPPWNTGKRAKCSPAVVFKIVQ